MNERGNTLAGRARTLIESNGRGVIATLIEGSGFPYGSLAEYLPVEGGDVVMFLSALAEHRRFLEVDARASLLVAPSVLEANALALPRVTLVGRVEPAAKTSELAERYVARHPGARMYIDFPDFQFFRLRVERARYIAGFGEMGWIEGDAYRSA